MNNMKKTTLTFCLLYICQIAVGQVSSKLAPYVEEVFYTTENQLNFIRVKESQRITEQEIAGFINSMILDNGVTKVSLQKSETDELGFTHKKFTLVQNGITLSNKIILAHCVNGKLVSLNGDLTIVNVPENTFTLSEKDALSYALNRVHAKKYKWENKAEEAHMRESLNQSNFTYYPHGTKVIFEKNAKSHNAYQFNIYAEDPLYRANVFVDAATGKILDEQNLICNADVPATAVTKFSGNQSFTNDQNGSIYRLREVQRGLGVETYNMKNTSTYSSTDFTNTTTSWTTTGVDQGATDAHWGAEKTYDYYFTQHNRNSINNNGYKLLSYVHYQTNYSNAFWDGQRMTYGDGNGGSMKIFTALDVCGHEITHGLTSNTGNLTYSNESGALNESFSDIFGTAIENYGRPGNWNWKIGEDITSSGNGLRSMSSPNSYGDPDTYGGTNYYTGTADNGGVHTNSGVSNFWFYLLTTGGSGTNDLSNVYSVSGIGITNAAKIAFRALTVYFTPSTNFITARNLSIQAAKDLFGNCSNEVVQTTRAWYAVGVGANYVNGVVGTNFTANITNFCSAPASVSFSNTTSNGLSYTWHFGDGSTSTSTNAVHSYSVPGTYSVKLKATGCLSVLDSLTKTSYIVVNPPVSNPLVTGGTTCLNGQATLSATGSGSVLWYNVPTGGLALGAGNSFVTPYLSSTTTFYAANTLTLAPVNGGIPSNTGGGYLNNNAQWLIFNVMQNSVLNSVVVYAQTAGNRIIQLRNSSNVILSTTTASLSIGANTVVLSYNLSPGTNYQLGLSSSSASNLYRSNSAVNYPYNIGGAVSIVNSSAGLGSYYFFYNWNVSREECASSRLPVVALINQLPAITVIAPSTVVCVGDQVSLTGSPAGGIYSGSNVNASTFSAAGPGTYTVTYTYTDMDGCGDLAKTSLIVEECTGLSRINALNGSVLIYPNPAKDYFVLKSDLTAGRIVISDASGRLIQEKEITSYEEKLKLDFLANGIYILSIKNASDQTVKTVKLVKN
jgi:Zn-dependent metalloprotease